MITINFHHHVLKKFTSELKRVQRALRDENNKKRMDENKRKAAQESQ